MVVAVMQRQRLGGSTATVSAAEEDCVGGRVRRAGRGRDGAFLVERGRRPCNEEGRKAAVAARRGRHQQPRGKEGSGGMAMKVAAARRGRQRRRNNGSANQKVQVRSGGNAYQHISMHQRGWRETP